MSTLPDGGTSPSAARTTFPHLNWQYCVAPLKLSEVAAVEVHPVVHLFMQNGSPDDCEEDALLVWNLMNDIQKPVYEQKSRRRYLGLFNYGK